MNNFTIRTFIRTMQNETQGYYIYKIDESVNTSYDPEEDTKLLGYYEEHIDKIPAEYMEAEIQDFYIESDLSSISFYI
ncbi:MAG: hypothetical protein J5725_00535 [Bacteroidales bacterium]|nr:hypothetical protein [Bacteroidales bacterium]